MTNLEKVLRYTRSTKSRKARLDAHFAREATHVLTRAEVEEQLNAVPNQHKASFLYLPSAYQNSQNLLAQTDFRSFDKVNANVEMENGVAKLVTQAVNGHHFLEESFAGASAAEEDVTIRVQAKANGKRYLMLQVEGNGENSEDAWIDLQTGEFFTRQTLPADFDGGAVAAFGLQQLSDDIGDNPITVVRSSDEAERDFTLDEITDGTLLSFVNEDVVKADTDFSTGFADTGENGLDRLANQSIGGRSGVLKGTIQATTEEHRLIISGVDTAANTHRIQTSIYIPSGQSGQTVDGFRIENGGLQVYATTTTKDAWVDIDVTWTSVTNSNIFIKFLPSGGAENWTGNGTDEVYIGDVTITQTTADGHIKNWRSHKDNGISADQTDIIKMPKIVDGGILVTENGKAAIDFDGVNDMLQRDFIPDIAQPLTLFHVRRYRSNGVLCAIGYDTTPNTGYADINVSSDFRSYYGSYLGTTTQNTNRGLWYSLANGTNSEVGLNGATAETGNAGTAGLELLSIGSAAGSFYAPINTQEIIIFNSDQSSNRKNIERKLADIMERPQLIEGHTDAGLINNITTIVGDDGWVDCFVSLKSVATTGIYRIGCSDEPKYKHYTGDGTGILLRKPQMYNGTVKRDFVPYNKPTLSIESLAIVGSDLTIDRNSKATNVNRELLLEEVEADVPRFQFGEGGVKGHLVEPQLTNYALYSSTGDDWDKRPLSNPVIVTQNSTIAPDGSLTGLRLSNFTNPGINIVNNSVVWVRGNGVSDPLGGTKYFGLWIKSEVGNEQITLVVRGSSNGTNPLVTHLIDITEEWNYYQVSTTFSAANGGSGLIGVISNFGTEPASFYVWGAQLSETPGSLVPTNGAAATRLAERATTPTIQKIQSGILQLKVYNNKHAAQYILSSASNTYAVFLEANVVYVRALTLSTAFFNNVINWGTYEGDINMVVKFDNGEVKLFLNGVTYTPFTNTFATDSEFGFDRFGDSSINNRDSNATYEKIALLPVLLSDEQCLQLSQL